MRLPGVIKLKEGARPPTPPIQGGRPLPTVTSMIPELMEPLTKQIMLAEPTY
jgi:hypothetical protein